MRGKPERDGGAAPFGEVFLLEERDAGGDAQRLEDTEPRREGRRSAGGHAGDIALAGPPHQT